MTTFSDVVSPGMMKKNPLFIDLETFSSEDLAKAGVFRYVEAPDFEILLMSYAFGEEPVRVWDFVQDGPPPWLAEALTDPEIVKAAHNYQFERACLNKALGVYTPPEQWVDTMHLAAMNGLPMTLEAAGAALQLDQQKLDTGKALIRYFCKPCAATKTNGGRTRNRPEHAPEKWAQFKEYCLRDTETERAIYSRLWRTRVTETERRVECLDARINERGIQIDLKLASEAIAMDEAFKAVKAAEMRDLARLENPNSVAQLKTWLGTRGLYPDSLDKKALADLLTKVTDPTTRRVLQLRQLLGKSSTAKYAAMEAATCRDGRIRGTLQYYGAGRTGRWAGRLIQVQNLPQNHLDQIDLVRDIVRRGDLEGLELVYDNVPDVLSQLIRTAIVAKDGCTFLVADYHAIEAVCIAYLAGEKWRLDVFAGDGKIYEASYAQAFGVPKDSVKKGSPERQKGKIMELACIAEGSPVLTDIGLVPIEAVTTDMRVWDGLEWVRHEGVVYRGEKEVITYDGLAATPDHKVWVRGQAEPVRLDHAAASGACLAETGAGRHPLRVGGDNEPRETMEPKMEPLLRTNPLHGLRGDSMAGAGQSAGRPLEGLSDVLPASNLPEVAGQAVHGSQAALHKSQRQRVPQLRCPGNSVPLFIREGGLPLYDSDERPPRARTGDRPDRRQRSLRTGRSSLGNAPGELHESAQGATQTAKVYDLLNAGPRHRFTVAGVLVSNCGYGGGIGALKQFGADKLGLSDDALQDLIDSWRAASPRITALWRACEKAAKAALRSPGNVFKLANGCAYTRDRDALRLILPSGRRLSYWGACLDDSTGSIRFMGQNQTTRKWEKMETWGGRLVENIVQAFARDILAEAMLRLEDAGYPVVFSVHDECIVEAPEGSRWEDVAEIMGQPVSWAPDLARYLHADGYSTRFYKKD